MAKKTTSGKKAVASKSAPVSTPVRNTPIPKIAAPVAAPAKKVIGYTEIALRAYEIHLSGTGGDETSNWLRAEGELRGA